jgi:hypothetical protein
MVSFCTKLYTMYFHNIQGLKVSTEIFTNFLFNSYRSFFLLMSMLEVQVQVQVPSAQQWRKALFSKHIVPHARDDHRHFA